MKTTPATKGISRHAAAKSARLATRTRRRPSRKVDPRLPVKELLAVAAANVGDLGSNTWEVA